MNRVEIRYCYPTSQIAVNLGNAEKGGFYVVVGVLHVSPLFRTIDGAEGFCRNNCLTWEPHKFRPATREPSPGFFATQANAASGQ